jgi:hypothetical protein
LICLRSSLISSLSAAISLSILWSVIATESFFSLLPSVRVSGGMKVEETWRFEIPSSSVGFSSHASL